MTPGTVFLIATLSFAAGVGAGFVVARRLKAKDETCQHMARRFLDKAMQCMGKPRLTSYGPYPLRICADMSIAGMTNESGGPLYNEKEVEAFSALIDKTCSEFLEGAERESWRQRDDLGDRKFRDSLEHLRNSHGDKDSR